MNSRRHLCLAAAVLLMLLCIAPPPMVARAASMDGMVRVHLASIGSPTALDVTVEGGYSVDGAHEMNLYDGQKVSFAFDASTGNITMRVGSQSYQMGREVALRRRQANRSGLYIAQAKRPKCIYEGDLQLIARPTGSGYKLYPIVHVFIETYLHGVVPNEMSSSWPLEALKAQAVTARTYTLNRMNSQSSALYDLGDTAAHQVYYGYAGTVSRAVQAVNETAGVVLIHGGNVCSTYYTASNGGQTESAKNIWGGSRYPYLTVKDDPYDAANPDANRRKRTVYKDFDHASQNADLQALLTGKTGAAIRSIDGITLHTPKYPSPSRLYTQADFALTLQNGTKTRVTLSIFGELEAAMGMSITSSDNELWTVTDNGSTFTLTAGRWGHGVGLSQRGAQQMANSGLDASDILAFYFDGSTQTHYTFTESILPPIGTGATVPPTAPPMNPGEQLATVDTNSSTLNLRTAPSTQADVIAEIPRGTVIVVTTYGAEWCAVRWNSLTGYVMTNYLRFDVDIPTDPPTPTDPPEESPVPTDPSDEQTPPPDVPDGPTAALTANAELHTAASESSEVLLLIPAGEVVTILDEGNPWTYIAYSGLTGYIPTAALGGSTPTNPPSGRPPLGPDIPAETPEITPIPTPNVTWVPVDYTATAVVNAHLLLEPVTNSTILANIPAGTVMRMTMQGGKWAQVVHNGQTGWVVASLLKIEQKPLASAAPTPTATPTPTPKPTATPTPLPEGMLPTAVPTLTDTVEDETVAWVVTSTDQTPLYQQESRKSPVLAQISGGTQLFVLNWDDLCQVRVGAQTGYIRREHLTAQEPQTLAETRYINTETDPLALRDAPTTSGSRVLTRMPRGEKVTLLRELDDWCYVRYGSREGYCAARYLSRHKPEEAVQMPETTGFLDVTLTAVTGWTGIVEAPEDGSIMLHKWCASSAPEVGEIADDERVELLKKGNIWCQITYEGTEGYCLTTQLKLIAPSN